ncbi:hypothetical protein Axi01nite_58000 [Actinoplanes xinjiangensis]|nr:hypothetical protein Axi01nite_58000 [Actinoplanes xinjiangensis]
MVMTWYSSFEFWCATAILLYCLIRLTKVQAWWRGEWSSSRIRWRDRAWLMIVISVAMLMTTLMIIFPLDPDTAPPALLLLGRSLIILSAVLFLTVPLVGWVSALDFAVPPHLRTGAPPWTIRPARPAGARPAPRLGPPVPGRTAIRFHRPAVRFKDRFRAYRLEIDGETVGEIRHGGEVTIVTTPGTRTVRALIDWMESPPLTVTVQPGRTVTVLVEPGDVSGLDAMQPREDYLFLSVDER